MTITIRTIKRRPGGRESIRERDIEKDVLAIGRDPSGDLILDDLSLSLKHARIKRDNDGTIVLDLIDGSRASIDGRLKSGRIGNLKPGTVIRFGRFELQISEETTPEKLTLTLEQVEAVEAKLSAEDENAIFGLQGALPGKRLMAWAFSLAILGFFLILPIWVSNKSDEAKNALPVQADLSWNTGPISLMHSNLTNDCASCHEKPFTPVQDQACTECHTNIVDHARKPDMAATTPEPSGFDKNLIKIADQFGRDQGRCASCHVEHNTRSKIVPASQELCADCHAGIEQKLAKTELHNASDFGNDHPQFAPSVITTPDFQKPVMTVMSLDDNPKGFSGLKFPHKMHMEKTGGVAKMAGRLGENYGFADGVDCADCHRPEAGGALFDPISMREDCAMCHSLVFEDDEGYQRTLRHGEPEEVVASMRDFYESKALANIRDAEANSTTRRRPGRAASLKILNRRELAFKQADSRVADKVESIFSKGGACFDCHEVIQPTEVGKLDYRLKPISLNDQFYFKSPFNHKSHEIGNLECKSCHAAETSKSSADVLLPKIEVCRDCHVGEEKYKSGGKQKRGTLPTTCLTCHTYHGGPHAEKMAKTDQ